MTQEPPLKRPLIRVLGPVDLLSSGVLVPLGGHHQRKLLAALVLAANHAVSMESLARVLWGEDAPSSRDNTIQSYVYRLRHLIGADAIVSEDHSYMLRVDADDVDALRFEVLLNQAADAKDDPERRNALAREALALWRGEPFGDLGDEDPFRVEAIRLVELRLSAMELRLESDLALGSEEKVVGTVEAMVEEHPYNEKLWYLLIEALSRSGRRVDALRAVGRLSGLLAEVGLEPSAAIGDLEERIVMGDREVTLRPPV